MKMSKAIKRIVALGTGVTMVGATILGAMAAADLSNYPEPFVDQDEGTFNALMVVGSKAAADDIVGAIDIAASLQYATRVMTPIPGASATATVDGEGVKIEGSSSELELGQAFVDVKSKIDVDDLPNLLADGVYVADGDNEDESYDFTQELAFGALPAVDWQSQRDYDEDSAHLLVFGDAGADFMEYTLSFTQDAESDYGADECDDATDLCDFRDTVISFLGMDYEITDANLDGTDVTFEMMGGLGTYSMYEGETQTFEIDGEDYEVTVDIVSDTGLDCVLTVNGESTDELEKGDTTTVAGVSLGIKKLMPNEAGEEDAGKDYVQFYLGANKLTLTNGEPVELGTSDIDDVVVTITGADDGSGERYVLEEMVFTWTPEEDIIFGAGEEVEFPLGGFSVAFEGLTEAEDPETIEFAPSGDDTIEMTVPLYKGEVTMDFLYWDGAALAYGEDDDSLIYMADQVDMRDGDYLFCSDEEESHILELTDIDSDDVVYFKDLATGNTVKGTDAISIGECDFTLANADTANNEVDVAGAEITNVLYTPEGMEITFDAVTPGLISLAEETENGEIGAGETIDLEASSDGDSSDVDVVDTGDYASTDLLEIDEDVSAFYTTFGTFVTQDDSDDSFVTIEYPGEMLYPEVFLNGEDATIVSGGAGTYEEVQRISAGMAKLDSEISDIEAQNLVVVGGPCVNTVAAQLLGNPAECTAGFEDGKAMIKLFDNGNKVAMLVAGYSAADTTRATRVVAEYDSTKYSKYFDGTELEVAGTSLSDISVSAPSE